MLITCSFTGINLVYPLTAGLLIFILIALDEGFKIKDIIIFCIKGIKQSYMIIVIFILIGAIIPIWIACGTLPYIIYHSMKLINPGLFVLSIFLVSCAVSFILGSSFGTVGTAGIALMTMAVNGNVNISLAAGAIIAGSYFGDRCSPMSSSANLVARITHTDIHTNIINMLKTSVIPFALSIVIYTYLSFKNPLIYMKSGTEEELAYIFNISIIVLIPAAMIFVLSLFRVDIRLSMLVSIVVGFVFGIFLQNEPVMNLIKYVIVGYSSGGNELKEVTMQGGGMLSMTKVSLIVLISSAYSGIFEGADLLYKIKIELYKVCHQIGLFNTTIGVSIITACFGCTQTLSILMTQELVKDIYNKKSDKHSLALDIENTAVVLSALVPWNIAGFVPASIFLAGPGFIKYAVYIYLIPLVIILKGIIMKYTIYFKD